MGQNVYDDPEFFDRYIQFPRQQLGLDGAPEWPLVRDLLPPMTGTRVADLGCGFGWFARWAVAEGATSVLGIDESNLMLDRANADSSAELTAGTIRYERADLDTLELPADAFDLAFSSLTMHYVLSLSRMFTQIRRSLADGGSFIYTTEHPIFTAPTRDRPVEVDGHQVWPLDRYSDEGQRTRNWLADGVIKQHRTVATQINTLIQCGFVIQHIAEFGPSNDVVEDVPALLIDRNRPAFLIIKARAN